MSTGLLRRRNASKYITGTPLPPLSTLVYGVKYQGTSNPTLTRIGDMEGHVTLPVQSLMRRCVVNDAGHVVYYLKDDDSTKKANGTPAVLDGTDGQVMVEIPEHWRSCYLDNGLCVKISLVEFEGAIHRPKSYVSAYEATLDRTIAATPKLASVVNTTPNFRGGDPTDTTYDGTARTYCGLPMSTGTHNEHRTYGHNRGNGWAMYDYNIHLDIYWLFCIEYATLNSQLTFDSTLTIEGYKKGGLGIGATVADADKLSSYNGVHAFVPCGVTNSLGNNTGFIPYSFNSAQQSFYGGSLTVNVPSYRGVENPFGHIWKRADGALSRGGGGTTVTAYVCRDPSKYSSSITSDYISYGNMGTRNTYCESIIPQGSTISQALRVYGDIFDKENSTTASTTLYFCDYHYHHFNSNITYSALIGGQGSMSDSAGLCCLYFTDQPTAGGTNKGTRLCYTTN